MARFIGQYEVLRELGAGHFGTVYAAVGEVPGRGLSAGKRRLVAIKQLHDDADPDQVELLHQEFALLDQVKHRCIVRVYEFLEEESAVVMEYVHGVTLRDILTECAKAREQVFTEAALEILIELADGLYQAWTTPGDNGEPLSLVHRDLKPANIMLTPKAEVKILDFGLARVDNAEFRIDDPDRIKGTPLYMAPEQARGEGVDHRTDLFALGLVGYELFMGRPAYRVPEDSRDPVGDVFDAIEGGYLAEQCAELESKVAGAGGAVTRLLQANPRSRYRTGHDLLADLRRQLYRDRGSYIQEFAEFFFDSLYRLEAAPDPESAGAGGAAPRKGTSGRKRRSIEDRLAESQARRSGGKAGGRTPRGDGRRPTRSREPKAGETGRELAQAKRFGSGSGTASPAPASDKPKKAKVTGARSADETGMMELGSLSSILGSDDEGNEPSATTFFSIASPKERAAPAVPPPMTQSAPGIAPAPAIGGPPQPGYGAPPPPAAPAFTGPTPGAISGPTPGAISGPTPGGGGAGGPGGPGTHFAASAPPPPAGAGERTTSGRFYALLLSIFGFVGIAVVAVVWLRPGGDEVDADPGAAVISSAPIAAPAPAGGDDAKGTEDTALPMPDPVRSAPRKSSSKKSSSKGSGSTGASSGSSSKSSNSGSAGTLTVKLDDKGGCISAEVTCGSGFRARGNFSNSGVANVKKVPQESCKMSLKGCIGSYSPVHGNQTISCRFSGTTLVCQ